MSSGGEEPHAGYHGIHAYRQAGVDLEAAAAAVDLIRDVAAGATRPEVATGIGGFAGLYRIGGGRLLAAGADGVGTKTEMARLAANCNFRFVSKHRVRPGARHIKPVMRFGGLDRKGLGCCPADDVILCIAKEATVCLIDA